MRDNKRLLWVLVLIFLLAAGLRLGTVAVHGLDGDDGFSLGAVQGYPTWDYFRYLGSAEHIDHHPKLYYLTLHLWIKLAGTSLLGLRSLSIFVDLLLGAFLIQNANVLFNRRVAVITGVLWAVNPLLMWVGGLVRMYSLLALLATLAWLFLLRVLLTPRRIWWGAFALAALGAAYTHILGIVVLLASGVVLVWWAFMRRPITRQSFTGFFVLGGVGVLYLPFMIETWVRRAPRALLAQNPPANILQFLQDYLGGMITNRPPIHAAWLWLLTALIVLLLIAAWVFRSQWSARQKLALTGLWLTLGGATLGFSYFMLDAGLFQTKYYSFIAPLFLLAVGVGISALPTRSWRLTALSMVVGFSLIGLWWQLQPTAWDDFPSAAEFIATQGDSADLVIVMSSYGAPPFRYHFTGESDVIDPWHGISADMPLDDLLSFVTQGYDTTWLVFYQADVFDPAGLLDGWFRARYPLRAEVFPNRATVRGYDMQPVTDILPPAANPLDDSFNGQVALRGYELATPALSRQDRYLHPPSGWLHVTLYWEALHDGAAVQPILTVENEYGQVYGGMLTTENDLFTRHPTTTWEPGQIWRSDFTLNLNPDMPPGQYKVVVRVLDSVSGSPLLVDKADLGVDWVIVDRVQIMP
ncbi:glycosyltransferase family 39 protein [Chloroflexota bacterium]